MIERILRNDKKACNKGTKFGVRVNPVIGAGSIDVTSTAASGSKFGIELVHGATEKLVECFRRNSFMQGLHVHVGSQGCGLKLLVAGAKAVVDLAHMINGKVGRKQVKTLDIGGGLPVAYGFDDPKISKEFNFQTYSKQLRKTVPELWKGNFNIITEFGRSLMTRHGYTASKA